MNKAAATRELGFTKGWIMWGLVSLFYGYQFFIRVSPSVMSEELMSAFGVTAGALGILSSSYYLVYSPLQLPLGILMDRFGPRRLAGTAVFLCAGGCFVFAASTSLGMAQLGRMLMGAGSACAFLSCMKVSSTWLPSHRFTTAAGFTMMIGTLGAMTASRPLAELIATFQWRPTLNGLGVVGIFLALAIVFLIQDKRDNSKLPTSSLLSGVASIARNPQCWLVAFYTFLMYAPMVIFGDIWGVPYFMQRFCVNCVDAAFPASMLYFGIAFGAPFFAWLSDTLQSRRIPMFITTITVLGIFMALLFTPGVSLEVATGLIFVTGFCLGGQFLGFPVICELNPQHLSGTAVGFNNAICMLSGVLFQPCVGYVLDMFWAGSTDTAGVRLYTTLGYTCGLSIIPVCALVGTGIVFLLKETHPLRKSK